MTVSTEVNENTYTGNGTTTVFPYKFRVYKKSDLVVQVVDLSETIKTLTLDTDYTVSGAGGYQGGNVTLTSPLATGWKISITRELPVTQETDLRNQGSFFAEVHEDAFDKLTMLLQQIRRWFGLALRKPTPIANWYDALNNYIRNLRDPSQPQDAATKNYVDTLSLSNLNKTLRTPENIPAFPNADDRANKVAAFDSAGNPIASIPVSGSAADVMLQFASAEDGKGDALMAVKAPFSNSVPRTQHDKNLETISVKDFGAVGDGATDDTVAIQAAVAACTNKNATLYFPPGYYIVSSVVKIDLGLRTHITLRGSGTSSTVIKCVGEQSFLSATSATSNNIWLDSVTPNGSLDIVDMSIGCWGGTDLKGTAVYLNTNTIVGTPAHSIHFHRVDFRCESGIFNSCIYIKNSAQIKIDSCNFYSGNGSQKGIAISYGNDDGKDGAGLQVSNCEFFFFQYGVYVTDHYEGGQFINCNFINCYGGIFAVIDGAESGIFINGCEFDCYFKGVYLQNVFDFVVADSCFFAIDSDSYYGIHVKGGSRFTITGNKIQGESSSVTGGIGILLENTDDALGGAAYVGGNAIGSMNIGMQISDCKNITFGPWAWRNCNVDTLASGTNTFIQQGNYEQVSTIIKTLSAPTTSWNFTVDISSMRLKRTPEYANIVSQSVANLVCRYIQSASSNTTLSFEVTYGDKSSIAANTYGFSLMVKSQYFVNVN